MSVVLLLLFWGSGGLLHASDGSFYGQGQGFAAQQAGVFPQKPADIPGDQGTAVPEASFAPGQMPDALEKGLRDPQSVTSFLLKTHADRLRFDMDPDHDPLLTHSDAVVKDPLAVLEAEETEIAGDETETRTTHTCIQSAEPFEVAGEEERVIRVSQPAPQTHRLTVQCVGGEGCSLTHDHYGALGVDVVTGQFLQPFGAIFHGNGISSNWGTCAATRLVLHPPFPAPWMSRVTGVSLVSNRGNFFLSGTACYHLPLLGLGNSTDIDIHYKPPVTWQEEIAHSGPEMEPWVDQGLCFYDREELLEGPSVRSFAEGEVVLDRPWWRRRRVYRCVPPQKNTCAAVQAQGCVQVGSTCVEEVGGRCVTYRQTYACVTSAGTGKRTRLAGSIPWCLDGGCAQQGYAPNRDMADALSKLMIFREIQKEMALPQIFKGDGYGCNRNCINFRDCCGLGKGWGVSLGLAGCSAQEKALSQLRTERKCVLVGTFCAEKLAGVCLRKKTTFCCFGSPFSRILQEQGRAQLGLGFGEPREPQCRGLTVEELTRLDFAKIDLSELFQDVMGRVQLPNGQKLAQDLKTDWRHRVKPLRSPAGESRQEGGPSDGVF